MPELRTIEIPATEIKKGDIINDQHVETVKVGRKWVNLTPQKGCSFALDETVTVQRGFETEAEKAAAEAQREAEQRAHAARRLQEKLTEALENTPQKALAELAASDRSFSLVDHWAVDRLLQLQAEYDFYALVDATLKAWAEKGKPERYADDEDIFAAMAVVYLRNTSGATTRNPLSRSSSPLSNIVDDLKVYTAERICDRIYGYFAQEIVARVRLQHNAIDF